VTIKTIGEDAIQIFSAMNQSFSIAVTFELSLLKYNKTMPLRLNKKDLYKSDHFIKRIKYSFLNFKNF
jgi:hypothetical protein